MTRLTTKSNYKEPLLWRLVVISDLAPVRLERFVVSTIQMQSSHLAPLPSSAAPLAVPNEGVPDQQLRGVLDQNASQGFYRLSAPLADRLRRDTSKRSVEFQIFLDVNPDKVRDTLVQVHKFLDHIRSLDVHVSETHPVTVRLRD